MTSSVGQPAETALTAVAAAGDRIVAAGSQPDGKPVTWRSNDRGATWQGPEPVPADGGSSVAALITIDGHFVAVGELVGAAPGAAVWRSSDGLEWVLDASVRGGGGLAAAAAGSVAAVAAGNDGHGEAAVWSILSGSARQVVAPPSSALTAVAVVDITVVVASGPPGTSLWISGPDDTWTEIGLPRAVRGLPITVRSMAVSGSDVLIVADDGRTPLVWLLAP